VVDERNRYFRQLRRLRRAARRWSIAAGTFGGASAILVPYHGLGWPDAIWAAVTGGSAALAYWRWSDLKQLSAQPAPEAVYPAQNAFLSGRGVDALVSKFPAGRTALVEMRRMQARVRVRGSSVAPAWIRLDRAAQTFSGLATRLGGPAQPALREAAIAERTLRELGDRTAAVERALRFAPGDAALKQSHASLLGHFNEGVGAYEKLVAAAAGYVAEDGHTTTSASSINRLTEATDLLHGVAAALSELRATGPASAF
jgi:hypothetical protein